MGKLPNPVHFSSRHRSGPRPGFAVLAVGAASALALALAPTAVSAQAGTAHGKADAKPGTSAGASDKTAFFDSRNEPAAQKVLQHRADVSSAHPKAGVTALRKQLGVQALIDIDPLTSTPRQVARLDGFLTGASRAAASRVALSYVRGHTDVFGLSAADLRTLTLRQDYVDAAGTHHLSWVQNAGKVTMFGNGLKANVAKDGRLISVLGSPVHAVASFGTASKLSATAARSAAVRDIGSKVPAATAHRTADGSTRFSNGDSAKMVAFQTVGGARLAWQTVTTPAKGQLYLHVVDASSGRVLYRRNLVQSDNPTGLVWENYPGAPRGGKQKTVSLTQNNWLARNATTLNGTFTHTFSDVNDNDRADAPEEVAPARFPFVNFNAQVGPPCSASFPCSWDPATVNSWVTNRAQNAVQVFYFVSKFHDHLNANPIAFTRAAGNFDARDGDAVQSQPDDGANTAGGLPDSNHTDNANMGTPPDGTPPTMQMFLFHDPADPTDPFLQSNGGDEADVVYHEYTHGLSNRLVVDAAGVSTLGNIQAGSMGEAWSDWYAMDFLNAEGFVRDTAAVGELRVGQYVGIGQDLIRTQPMDCPVGSTSPACHGTPGAGPGGYTYGDFGKIIGAPEVHADGEIWGETLWDLRTSIGSKLAESLVTRAMELSPANPSYLDERNSILQADMVVNRGRAFNKIWAVFAHRGMGWFAGAVDGDDTQPAEDFSLPPAPGTPTGTLTGVVSDDASGGPISGAFVRFGGHASGFPGDYAATTGPDGRYTISGIFAGTYPKVSAGAPGFDRQIATLSVNSGTSARNWQLRRDWAALSGGATVAKTNGDEFASFGCGAAAMFDQSQGNGWSADRTVTGGSVLGKFVTVQLPVAVNISSITVDPSNTCGDGGSASTGPFTLETSTDGVTFTTAASGTFGVADRGHFSTFPLTAAAGTGVRFVRYTMLDSQVKVIGATCPGPFSGCDFIDSRELEVYGAAS